MRRTHRVFVGLALLAGLVWLGSSRTAPVSVPPGPDLAVQSGDPLLHTHNPLTGHDYTPSQAARIAFLREKLPDNSLVPTTDPATQARRAEQAAAQDRMQPRIVAGAATGEEVHAFYEVQRQSVQDRVELAKFILAEPQWEASVHEKYERVLAYAEGQLLRIDQREADSLAHQRVALSEPQSLPQ